jgi:hypothetical protein
MDGSTFLTITFLNLWWIALWGVSFIIIEYISGKSKIIELCIYITMMAVILVVLSRNPHLIPHIV